MSANLNELNGKVSFVANAGKDRKEIAWHGLGTYFDRPLSTKEILEMPNFSYQVEKGSMLHVSEEIIEMILAGKPVNHLFTENDIIQGSKCTFRNDTNQILGVVSDSYQVVQNFEGFSFIDNITGIGEENALCKGAYIETAGILGNGERIFITAKLPSNIRIGNSNEEITDYLLFTNGHDGKNAVTAMFTPIRVVCNNTLNAALRTNANRFSFRHTTNVHTKLDDAIKIMDFHSLCVSDFEKNMNILAAKKITDKDVQRLISKALMTQNEYDAYIKNGYSLIGLNEIKGEKGKTEVSTRLKNKIDEMVEYIHTGVGQEYFEGTGYWIYNGITSYYNNAKKYKDNELKLDSILRGKAFDDSQKVFETVMAY